MGCMIFNFCLVDIKGYLIGTFTYRSPLVNFNIYWPLDLLFHKLPTFTHLLVGMSFFPFWDCLRVIYCKSALPHLLSVDILVSLATENFYFFIYWTTFSLLRLQGFQSWLRQPLFRLYIKFLRFSCSVSFIHFIFSTSRFIFEYL